MQNQLAAIAPPLIAWYRKEKRQLPWRSCRQPYPVWISEIMLQQTRIEAVIGYYDRFLSVLPDVEALSKVPDEQLLKLWEGLGYYSRARNLKKAAIMIMEKYGGEFPRTAAELKGLPGIGEYTAAAIASFCFNERVPAVDGNVLRVAARVTGNRDNVLLDKTKKEFTLKLQDAMPPQAGDFNEGMMELGEVICLPNGAPLCEQCPLREHCTAFAEGLTEELPVRIKKVKRRKEKKTVFLFVTENGETALQKRENKGLLSGMYELPNADGFLTEEEIRAYASENGLKTESITFLKEDKHIFTHIDWFMRCYEVRVKEKSAAFLWATPQETEERYPLPTAFKKFVTSEE